MQGATTVAPGKRLSHLFKEHWHRLFIAVAAVLLLVRYMPAVYFATFCSDNIHACLLYRDVIEQGHSAHGWIFGGHSDLFPDVTIIFLLEFLTHNALLTLQILTSILFAAWIAVCLVLYRQLRGRNIEILAALLALFFIACCRNFGFKHGINFGDSFMMGNHCGTEIMALVCFALCLHSALAGRGRAFWWLACACFISAASDALFMVIFPIPVLAALVISKFAYPAKIRSLPSIAANIIFFSASGLVIGPHISPTVITGGYTHPDLVLARHAWYEIWRDCTPSVGGAFVLFWALDILAVIAGMCLVIPPLFKFAVKRIPAPLAVMLLYCVCVIGCNVGAAVLTGNYSELGASRYIRFAFWAPVLVSTGLLNHLVPWPEIGGKIATAALSLLLACIAVFLPPAPDHYFVDAQRLIPVMHSLMEKEGIEAGLADYWWANVFTFLSHDDVKLRSVSPNGTMDHWLNNISWFAGSPPSTPAPKFRMIFMRRLDPELIRQRYGPPDRVVSALPGEDIWIYREERSISYRPLFGELANISPTNEFQVKARLLPSQTGRIEGDSIVARAGRDPQGAITFGPYLHPSPGRYRVEIVYSWRAAPAQDRVATFDAVLWNGSHAVQMYSAQIPFIDTAPQKFTREVRISDNDRQAFEVRTFYFASGDLGIDSLRITYLGE